MESLNGPESVHVPSALDPIVSKLEELLPTRSVSSGEWAYRVHWLMDRGYSKTEAESLAETLTEETPEAWEAQLHPEPNPDLGFQDPSAGSGTPMVSDPTLEKLSLELGI